MQQLRKSAENPLSATLYNLENYNLVYEIMHSIFLETAQLSDVDKLTGPPCTQSRSQDQHQLPV